MATMNAKALRAAANAILNIGEGAFGTFDQKKVNAVLKDEALMKEPTFGGLLRLIAERFPGPKPKPKSKSKLKRSR